MKIVPIFYWNHPESVTQSFFKMLSIAIIRCGYEILPICNSDENFEKNSNILINSNNLEFCIALTPTAIQYQVGDVLLINHLRCPIYVYMLDTCVYYLQHGITHEMVKNNNGNIYFGFPDAGQREIMRLAFRNKFKVNSLFTPFATEEHAREPQAWGSRDYDISIFGNLGKEISENNIYSTIEETMNKFSNLTISTKRWCELIQNYIDQKYPSNVVKYIFNELSLDHDELLNSEWINAISTADSFIKRQKRIQIVKNIKSRKVHCFGSGWEFLSNEMDNLVIHGVKDYNSQFDIFNKSKLSLNIDPNWDWGVHDRVFNAASMRSVPLTQINDYVSETLPHYDSSICYAANGEDIDDLININDNILEDIASESRIKTMSHHTWTKRIQNVSNYFSCRK